MIDEVLHPQNLYKAYYKVKSNKGSAGVDGMSVYDLATFKEVKSKELVKSILRRKYIPQAIKGVLIPKEKGKHRLLGVPTVVDRWLQQALSQQLSTKFEFDFEE